VLEQYLRIYTNYQQDDWATQLPLAEFTYNNTPHSATNVSPFFANKGYHPRLTISLDNIPSHSANLVATDLKSLHKYLRNEISTANHAYREHADERRLSTPDWKVGDSIWLSTENIRTLRPSKKLDHRRLGPFHILAKIGSHAYRLELPYNLRHIHNVFHVRLLELHHPDPFPARNQPPPPPIEIDNDNEYEVETILDSRTYRRQVQYLVKWKGYGPEEHTWEPYKHLHNARRLVVQFHKQHPTKPSAIRQIK
jgi:hypothetical protein